MQQTLKRSTRIVKRRIDTVNEQWYLSFGPEPPTLVEPNFLVMGAMKAGTTTLHDCLAQHPEIFMTYIKEPSYYLPNRLANTASNTKTRSELRKLMFKGFRNQRRIGESSTTYTEAPTVGMEAPANIHRAAPDMQFIYIVRNPFGRIVSHYLHCVERAIYTEPICDVLAKDPTFLERSLYASQLKRYLELFEKEQFLLLFFEEFACEPLRQLPEVCRFLEISEAPLASVDTRVRNQSVVPKSVRDQNSRFDHETYTRLMESIREDVEELESIMGRKINHWDLSETKWCRTG